MRKNSVWIIYNRHIAEQPSNACEWMKEEGKCVGVTVDIMIVEDFKIACCEEGLKLFYKGKEVDTPKVALFRCYNMEISQFLEELGVKIVNSSKSMKQSRNKWCTHLELSKNKIKVPFTLYSGKCNESYSEIEEILGQKFVVKGIYGSKGEEVFLVEDEISFNEAVEKLKEYGVIYQEFIESSIGRDIRVHVIGGKVAASILRSSESDFRSNYSLGGQAIKYSINEEIEKIAVKAADTVGLNIAGVDVLFGENGPVICEVNANAGFRTVWKCTDISIPREIMKYIKEKFFAEF